ncbi:MAG: hypothetical protein ACYDCG_00470 [Candidatus Acidiferrales bacterium]
MKRKTRTKKRRSAGTGTKKVVKPPSWEEFFEVRDAAIKADPRAFAEFMADRKDEAAQIRLGKEDDATLAAIDEGIADARAGRTFSAEEVRKICTGRDLAKALARARLSEDDAKAWRRDLRAARKMLKAPVDKWRGKR